MIDKKIFSSKEEEKKFISSCKDSLTPLKQDILLNAYYRFIYFIAKQTTSYKQAGLYISSGYLGLLKAIEKVDLNKYENFLTYAVFWIRHYILKDIKKEKFFNKPFIKVESLDFQKDENKLTLNELIGQTSEIENKIWGLEKQFENLTPKEKDSISLCFFREEKKSLKNLSRQRIQQLKKNALHKIFLNLNQKGLKTVSDII